MRQPLNLSVDEEFSRRLRIFCASTGRSMSQFVESCVRPHITGAGAAKTMDGESLATLIANEVARQLKERQG